MDIDLSDLKAFLSVARAKGFRDGARASGSSASGLSESVRRLETQLGVRLLHRTTRSVVPTEAGRRLLERLEPAFRLGLETSASLPVAQSVLESTGWKRFFDVVVSADAVARGKPAPDVYLRALELMHAKPALTAAIEDSANGIRSAHAAGIAVIAIPNKEFPPDAGALALASRVIENLDALDDDVVYGVLSKQT